MREQLPDDEEAVIPDERLELIFACCHPALAADAQVALTLSLVGGLTTPEIARAFIVPEATLAQRLVRAKRKIRDAGIPLRVPAEHLLPERLRTVLAAIYLVFNAGYGPPVRARALRRGDPARAAPRDADAGRGRGARPARAAALPGRAARRAGVRRRRARAARRPGPLALGRRGDRAGRARRSSARSSLRMPGPYQLQAAIASLHAEDETDWSEIALLYSRLLDFTPSPVVELNRGVAVALAHGRPSGPRARSTRSRASTTTTCSTRRGPTCCAGSTGTRRPRGAYERALELAPSEIERDFLRTPAATRAAWTEREARGGILILGGGFAGAYVARLLGAAARRSSATRTSCSTRRSCRRRRRGRSSRGTRSCRCA